MPHLVIEHSRSLEQNLPAQDMMKIAHDAALASGQFGGPDIKVRLVATDHALVGGNPETFLHIGLYLLSGRDTETKKALTRSLVEAFKARLPDVASISADARDMDRETYSKILR